MASTPPTTMDASPTTPVLPNKVITIRTFTPADLPAVIELFSAGMLEHAHSGKNSDHVLQNWLDFIEKCLQDDLADMEGTYFASGGHFWVATCIEANGEEVVVGMVGLEGKPDKAFELRRMSVRVEYRRFGVGKKLVAHLEQWARNMGVAKVWFTAFVFAVPALKFYSSLGYTQTKAEPHPKYTLFEVAYLEKELV